MRALLPPVVGPVAETLATSGPDAAAATFHRLAAAEPAEFDLDDDGFDGRRVGSDRAAPHEPGLAPPASVDRVASGLIRCLDDDRLGPSGRRASRPGEEPPPTRPRPRPRERRRRADHEQPPVGMTGEVQSRARGRAYARRVQEFVTATGLAAALDAAGDPEDAVSLQRYFKTGPGEYGEGDVFIGVRVPAVRALARQARSMPVDQAFELLGSAVHEHRLAALLVLVERFVSASRARTGTMPCVRSCTRATWWRSPSDRSTTGTSSTRDRAPLEAGALRTPRAPPRTVPPRGPDDREGLGTGACPDGPGTGPNRVVRAPARA